MKFESELEDEEVCKIIKIAEGQDCYFDLYQMFKTVLVVKEDGDGSRWISVDDLLEKSKV